MFVLNKKATCQFQIKFITDDYLQKYKTLQLFAIIKVIKNTNAQTYLQVSILLNMPRALKLGLNQIVHCSGPNDINNVMIITLTCTEVFQILFFSV